MFQDIVPWLGAGAIGAALILWAMILGYIVFNWLFGCGEDERN